MPTKEEVRALLQRGDMQEIKAKAEKNAEKFSQIINQATRIDWAKVNNIRFRPVTSAQRRKIIRKKEPTL